MAAVTYDVARVSDAAPAQTVAAPRKTWFARFMDALIEARMRQAQREIRLHIGLLPYSFDDRTNRLVKTKADEMPFGGW